jgi:hypothetical protein
MGIAAAAAKYSPGVSDSEIKIGQTTPYSGLASAYSTISKTQLAYIRMINERGGVNGRKLVISTALERHQIQRSRNTILPGIKINTSPSNYRGYNQMQLVRFDGKRWVPVSEIIGE